MIMKKLKRKKVKKRAKKAKTADMPQIAEYVSNLRVLHQFQGALLKKLETILAARNPGGGTG